MFSSLKMLCSPRAVTKCDVATGRLYGRTLSRTVPAYLYQPTMQKTSQILAFTKFFNKISTRFHWFWPNYSSQYLYSQASYQKSKIGKSKKQSQSLSHISFLLITSIQRLSQRPTSEPLSCPKWGMGEGGEGGKRGGGHALALITSRWGRAVSKHHSTSAPSPKSTSCDFSSWYLFRISIGCCETLCR